MLIKKMVDIDNSYHLNLVDNDILNKKYLVEELTVSIGNSNDNRHC